MGRFAVERLGDVGREAYALRDADAGTEARVLVGYGSNAYAFRRRRGGEPWDYIHADPAFATRPERPSGNGTPILFPFPNRIRGGRFGFEGRTVELERNDPDGHAIHGFVLDAPWRVEETGADGAARLRASIASRDLAGRAQRWPFPFRLEVTWALEGPCLAMAIEAGNPGSGDLPFGLGTHPYFRLPGPIDRWRLRVPVEARWELEACLPTGRILDLDPGVPLAEGLAIGDRVFDQVYTRVRREEGRARAWIEDPGSGRRLRLEADPSFREFVVYTPPHREAVAIEPYTCVTDAVNLAPLGIDGGLRVLRPGERFRATIWTIAE